jgi:hypothetical protein
MDIEEVLKDPTAAMAADLQRMLVEAYEAVKAFQDVQAQATRDQNASAKAALTVLKSNELVRLKARLPNVGERLVAVATGMRDRMEKTKAADKLLSAAINAFGKHINKPAAEAPAIENSIRRS